MRPDRWDLDLVVFADQFHVGVDRDGPAAWCATGWSVVAELVGIVGKTPLSTYAALTARAAELRREGLECAKVAEILNAEGWRPAKRRDTFNAQMVHHLLLKSGAEPLKYRRRPPQIERLENEWTIRELAREVGMPQPTLYTRVQKGRLSCRNVGGGLKRAVLVRADPETVAALKAIRATPPPWRRLPPRLANNNAGPTTTES